MFKHHQDSINNVIKKMKENDNVLALIIAGSIAHGFATEDSDVDIMIVVSQEEYERRCRDNEALYWEQESCTYEKDYVDGKYISTDFIKDVIRHGGEPARYAFRDSYIAYSKIPELESLMTEAAQYPKEYKEARMKWFYSQVHEWNWFFSEGINKKNAYLVNTAVCNIVLNGGRAILAYNELLYPYHKWFLKILEGAEDKPENLMKLIDTVLETKSPEAVASFVAAIDEFTDWGIPGSEWPKCNISDSELGCPKAYL